MQVFIMHVGHPGHVDIPYTVTRRRSASELLADLPVDAAERAFFEEDEQFNRAFPIGEFHCWGIPPKAKPAFDKTEIGDLILIIPWIGIHRGGVHQLGIVKAKFPQPAYHTSRLLWPKTPFDLPYPWLLFFDTEVGFRDWYHFLEDIGYGERWNPRGWYRLIADHRFAKWGDAQAI